MTDIKSKVQGMEANLKAQDISSIAQNTGSIYEALAIISKRAKQLSVDLKHELHQKLEEFAATSDAIEEIHENKEQIEISKFYERMPNPALIATNEYLEGELYSRYTDENNRKKQED